MREIINLQVGACGNQVGGKVRFQIFFIVSRHVSLVTPDVKRIHRESLSLQLCQALENAFSFYFHASFEKSQIEGII